MAIAILPGSMGIAWGKPENDAQKRRLKILGGAAAGVGILMTVFTDLYIQHQGYEIKF